eukprot:jgi/Pico_ML_1/54539/g4873.t1
MRRRKRTEVSNDELALRMDTSDEWIAARTGIRNRRVVSKDKTWWSWPPPPPGTPWNAPKWIRWNWTWTKPDGAERDRPASYANVRMNGQDVFKFAVRAVPATLKASAEKAGIGPEEFADKVDWLVLHQANQRIWTPRRSSGVPQGESRLPTSPIREHVRRLHPVGAGTRPSDKGRYDRETTVAIAGFGAGLTWASAIFRWG